VQALVSPIPFALFRNLILPVHPPLSRPQSMANPAEQSTSAAGYRNLLYAAVLLPFVCAVVAQAMGPTPQKPTAGEEPAGLVFEQYLVDLGEVPPIPMLEGRFRFTNRSDRTITITDLKPSCGCLNPRLSKHVYEPGEAGEFFVRVETAGEKSGQKEYYVDVMYEDSQARQVQLGFDFVLPERKVVVHPRALIFYQLGTDSTTREINISDYRDAQMTVLEGTCKSPYVSVTIEPTKTMSAGYRTTRVEVTVSGSIPPGKHQTILNLKTDDSTYPLVRVPLWIQGPDRVIEQTGGSKTRQPTVENLKRD
jgi:hypothetical protein